MASGKKKRWISPAMWLRYGLLAFILIYITYIGVMHQREQTVFPPVDALCPFGGLESLYSILFHGQYLNRIFISSFILLGITVILVFISGRSFCGWICPLGTLQGIMGGIGRRITKRKFPLSLKTDRPIRYLRYPILVVFTVGAWIGGKLLIRPYDPWVAYMHLSNFADTIDEFPIGLAILVSTLIMSLFIPRFFCRYLCPMGVFLGILDRVSAFRLERNRDTCINCMLCDKKCPVGIPVESMTVIDRVECLSCGECVPVCPVPDTLYFTLAKKRLVTPIALGVMVIVVFFGVIGLTKALGVYKSTSPSVKEMLMTGTISADEIKGYMTLDDVTQLFAIPIDTLYARLSVDPSIVPSNTKLKEIKSVLKNDFEADSVREVVSRILSESMTKPPEESSDLPSPQSIRGTQTIREVAVQFDIPLNELYRELDLDSLAIPPDTPCRDIKNLAGDEYHTTAVRRAVERILKN
ncbi:MAG: 4Fe-4S binding protein [candidate division Zixibacteria bacterium]|nr:4Fe-4S binding protein [candidate division Zixibacteria bacterium]